MRTIIVVLVVITISLATACAGKFDIFPEIGDQMSNPIALAIDSVRNRLYVNNSNYKVGYKDGSIHVVDITDPTAPVRVDYTVVPSFSGQLFLDTASQLLYTPNRYSSTEADRQDNLFRFNVAESSSDFLARSDYPSTDDPYGIVCCDAENRILTASDQGFIDYYDRDDALAHGSLDLTSNLSTGVQLLGKGATRIVIIGTQAVVTRADGGLWIVNLDELGVSGTYPVDYFIDGIPYPEGLATDGTYVYVVSIDYHGSPEYNGLFILDISSLTPLTSNTVTEFKVAGSDGLIKAQVDLVKRYPGEIALVNGKAYVAHFDENILSVVELTGYTKTGEIGVGNDPFGMAVYSPGGTPTHLFVANSTGNNVYVIDLATETVVGTYP